jgi:hypothetical protein
MGLKACHFKTMKVFQERDYTLFGLCKSQHRHAKVSSRLCFRSSPPHACPASLQLSRNLWYSSSRVVTVSHTPAPNTCEPHPSRVPGIRVPTPKMIQSNGLLASQHWGPPNRRVMRSSGISHPHPAALSRQDRADCLTWGVSTC